MKTIKLENWAVVGTANPYQAPETLSQHLAGTVTGHPNHEDGTVVRTSPIMGEQDGYVKTLSGSLYDLGTPHSTYEENYPNAKERLILSLRENHVS